MCARLWNLEANVCLSAADGSIPICWAHLDGREKVSECLGLEPVERGEPLLRTRFTCRVHRNSTLLLDCGWGAGADQASDSGARAIGPEEDLPVTCTRTVLTAHIVKRLATRLGSLQVSPRERVCPRQSSAAPIQASQSPLESTSYGCSPVADDRCVQALSEAAELKQRG